MRFICLISCFLATLTCRAQSPPANTLPEFVLIPAAADKYEWTRVLTERDRIIFNNAIAVSENVAWSFGGFNTERVLRALLRIEDRRLVADTIRYPGSGFMNNLFFVCDSVLYLGGGLDSGAALYSFADFWRYDLRRRNWSRLNDLPFYNHKPLHVFTEPGRVLVLVMALYGADLKQARPVCYEYIPGTDEWRILSQELPLGQLAGAPEGHCDFGLRAAAFRLDGDLYILFQPWENVANVFVKLSLDSGAWTKLEPFPGTQQLIGASFALSDGVFGYIGGGRVRSRADNGREVFRYDPVRSKWERIADLPLGLRYGQGWRHGGRSYVGFGISDRDETLTIWELRRKP